MSFLQNFTRSFRIFFPLISCCAFCSTLPTINQRHSCQKITVGPGLEDFALLEKGGDAAIIASSHERRGWKIQGEIFSLSLKTKQVKKLNRTGEPASLFFAPHGIDLFKNGQDTLVYVVNHGAEMNDNDQSILIYRLQGDALEFLVQVRDDLINSPNDISVTETGNFYVTNDHGSRGSFWEVLWGLKRSKVTYCTLNSFTVNLGATCKVAAENIAMANGILAERGKVYVSATREDKVYAFTRNADNTLSERKVIGEVPGPDNLFTDGKALITAGHTSNWKFFRHASSADNKAPSYIVRMEPETKGVTGIYFDKGEQISAASGAFSYKGKLYISQVFENFLLECKPTP